MTDLFLKYEELCVVLFFCQGIIPWLINPQRACAESYCSHFVSLSVCHFSILEKAPISGLKLTFYVTI